MTGTGKARGGPSPFARDAFDTDRVPDFHIRFIKDSELRAFAEALQAPEVTPITALNDWRPVHQRIRRKAGRPGKRRRKPLRSRDETREGFVYTLLKWPLLLFVGCWLLVLFILYLLTRFYIWVYEQTITWRGYRQTLRQQLRASVTYTDWQNVAARLDEHLGNESWKEDDSYAYYDDATIRRAFEQLQARRQRAMQLLSRNTKIGQCDELAEQAVHELKTLVESCVKNNFAGIENPRIYSETYFGTKRLAQEFIDELERCVSFLMNTSALSSHDRYQAAQHMHRNFGRTALCLSGGAGFAYYHFGVAKALQDASLLPDVITGTSGGALVAALLGTRTDEELKELLVPALADKITACEETMAVWLPRWWRTGARFDSIDWAEKCSWFCRGSMTFREAYERTGRILNITCIPSDPYSPTILANYITAPNCVIWSTVLASAAVPGILNPVVLMMKNRDGSLSPYSFGHKWKDGSLRTDIPTKALNLHFNCVFSIVSQVNPHINAFFFSSRGTVGRPVTHRRGRGWRGGFLGSALEQYLKLDLTKWLKVLRHLELLPRWLGQDWSEIWLQKFNGTITIWPRSRLSDFYYILSDPSPERLARMIHAGQQSTFSKLLFIQNRRKIERLIERGLVAGHGEGAERESFHLGRAGGDQPDYAEDASTDDGFPTPNQSNGSDQARRGSIIGELRRQSGIFFDDPATDYETDRSSVNGEVADLKGAIDKLL